MSILLAVEILGPFAAAAEIFKLEREAYCIVWLAMDDGSDWKVSNSWFLVGVASAYCSMYMSD